MCETESHYFLELLPLHFLELLTLHYYKSIQIAIFNFKLFLVKEMHFPPPNSMKIKDSPRFQKIRQINKFCLNYSHYFTKILKINPCKNIFPIQYCKPPPPPPPKKKKKKKKKPTQIKHTHWLLLKKKSNQ